MNRYKITFDGITGFVRAESKRQAVSFFEDKYKIKVVFDDGLFIELI